MKPLKHDPYNLSITGVGGQGNVMASGVIGNMLSLQGYKITVGETFGASQRGGSVRSDMRISSTMTLSPQMPKGSAHMIVGMEPSETMRVLNDLGNPDVKAICNIRAIQTSATISGELMYPEEEQHRQWLEDLTSKVWFVNTTEEAIKLGHPIFSNIMLIGALAGTGELPMDKDVFKEVISNMLPADRIEKNLTAFDIGKQMTAEA
jgi:indolepyruvate ferredoxin oxidoreductase beta subunit